VFQFAVLLAVLAACAPGLAQQCEWKDVDRIVAVGDVHGDHDQFLKTLRAAKVIDKKNNWSAGKAHLVQCGDVLDRGPDSRKAMDLLMALEKQAAKAGGRVHSLIGNHEAMVLMGDWRYVHPDEVKAFGGEQAFRAAMGPKGKYGKWIRSNNTIIRINDILFVHAGLAEKYADTPLEKINAAVRKELSEKARPHILIDPFGPVWYRGLALRIEKELEKDLAPAFRTHKAKHIVIGHTVSSDGIKVRAGGRVIMIDVGMCEHYGGPAGCLVVDDGEYFAVYAGKEKKERLDVGAGKKRRKSAAQ
jgi:hypothetical protein